MALIAFGGSVTLDVLGWDSTIRRWAVFPALLMVRAVSSPRPFGSDAGVPGVE